MKLISQAEFARLKGVSRQRVGQWLRDEIIKLTDGLVDPVKAEQDLRLNLDHSKRIDYEIYSQHGGLRNPSPLPSNTKNFPKNRRPPGYISPALEREISAAIAPFIKKCNAASRKRKKRGVSN